MKQPPPANGENCVMMLRKLCPVRPGAFQVGVTKVRNGPLYSVENIYSRNIRSPSVTLGFKILF